MNQQLQELRERIKQGLLKAGLKDFTKDGCTQLTFAYGDEFKVEKNQKYNFNELSGFEIIVDEVYRSNGTQENISMRIECMEWNKNSGRAFHTVKISYKDSIKKQERLIEEAVKAYNQKIGTSSQTELEKLCAEKGITIEAINVLKTYYMKSLKWDEEQATMYCIELFKNGTIDKIQVLGI